MSSTERPWWATDDHDEPGSGADPLEAHRAARRGDRGERGSGPGPEPDGESHGGATRGDPPPAGERPEDDGSWWGPATEALTRLARDLAASAVASPPRGLVDDTPDGAREPDASPPPTRDGGSGQEAGGGPHQVDACGVCPICVGLRAVGGSRPELVGHLAEAARQLTLALRSVVDAAAPPDGAGQRPRSRGSGRGTPEDLHRIPLDD